jgi:hypothetical protein
MYMARDAIEEIFEKEDIPKSHWWWYLEEIVGKPTEAVGFHKTEER